MTNNCWLWAGFVDHGGYGQFSRNGVTYRAHRLVYEADKGQIPEGLTLDHLCRNRLCVNPDHLEPVTLYENLKRGNSPSSINRKKTHCVNEHEFNEENTGWQKTRNNRVTRFCKECRSKHVNAWYARKKMAV